MDGTDKSLYHTICHARKKNRQQQQYFLMFYNNNYDYRPEILDNLNYELFYHGLNFSYASTLKQEILIVPMLLTAYYMFEFKYLFFEKLLESGKYFFKSISSNTVLFIIRLQIGSTIYSCPLPLARPFHCVFSRWQATRCPASTSLRAGLCLRQISLAVAHRCANLQPGAKSMISGRLPFITASASRSASILGMALNKPRL